MAQGIERSVELDGWWVATAVGVVAGCCSTVSFVPQLVKAWKMPDNEAISTKTYAATVTAFTLWLIYGALTASLPILIFNVLSLMPSAGTLFLKLRGSGQIGVVSADG